jgi:hypothetical protein
MQDLLLPIWQSSIPSHLSESTHLEATIGSFFHLYENLVGLGFGAEHLPLNPDGCDPCDTVRQRG